MPVSATPEFNSIEHLQDSIRRWFNREVREYFKDLEIDDNWSPNLNQSRQSLALACLHTDKDNLVTTQLRLQLFSEIRGQEYRIPFIGIPYTSFTEERRYKPQVILNFREDGNDLEPGYSPVWSRISFRLMNESPQSLTEFELKTLGNRIQLAMNGNSGGYIWRKGKKMFSYSDWSKGYQLQLLVRTQSEGRDLVTRVLDIQNHSPDWANANFSENELETQAYPSNPGTETVIGKVRNKRRKRPIADCRFNHAVLHVEGLPNPIVLFDRSYNYKNAIVRSY